MDKKSDSNKEMAELFYNLYMGCVKYKVINEEKNIKCDTYYKQFEIYKNKYYTEKSKH